MIIDFGSQYTQLIARRIREMQVYCEIVPFNKYSPGLLAGDVRGVVLSGSPCSVASPDAPRIDLSGIRGVLPLLGICYGAQYLANLGGGMVEKSPTREYGRAELVSLKQDDSLLAGLKRGSVVWMSHGDTITSVPDGFETIASTADVPVAAFHIVGENTWGIQFHPEVHHSEQGALLLKNFVMGVCGCRAEWTSECFVSQTVRLLKEQIGEDEVVMALSGGVDSTVAAVLLNRAIGDRLHCIFVDSGLMRKNEAAEVLASYKGMGLNVRGVDASQKFLEDLAGVTDPEQKRKIIGRDFVEVFTEAASEFKGVKWLGQGTIYPDVVESGLGGESVVIKSHHNVGGLPDCVDFKEIVEPLRRLFKDEVRKLGTELGLPDELVWRQPFPGPGLAIRVIGEVTEDKLAILRDADAIFREEMRLAGLDRSTSQFFAVLTDLRSVGVMGDERTYDYTLALRAVQSQDFMTATWSRLPYELLDKVSGRIVGEVKHINRICYDITSKPPATVEWE